MQNRVFPSLVSAIVCTLSAWMALADEPAPKPDAKTKPPSLDQQLRDSLDDDLLRDLPVAPKKKTPAKDASAAPKSGEAKSDATSPPQPKSALDAQLLDQLNEGEDLGSAEDKDPIRRIGRHMKQVEQLIQKRDTSAGTQDMQKQIAADLESLIQQMQKSQGGKSKSSGKPGSNQQNADQSGAAAASKPTPRPASDSTQRLDKNNASTDETARLRRMVKEVWGHLPVRIREQMQNVSEEQFLPQYEKLIEEYYRRLAEQGTSGR